MSRHQHYAPPAPGPLSLFDVPTPPSGPPAPVPTKAEGTREAYLAWRGTDDGARVRKYVEREALAALRRGETRISTRTLVCVARDFFKVAVNNNFSPYIADELVHDFPALQDVIERRVRRATT